MCIFIEVPKLRTQIFCVHNSFFYADSIFFYAVQTLLFWSMVFELQTSLPITCMVQ